MQHNLSRRIERLVSSPVRDILAAIDKPGMISFAGGLPADDSFPTMVGSPDRGAMQYGPSEGEPKLRECIAEYLQKQGLTVDPSRVLVISGSQQGIDLVAKLVVDNGTGVAVESPTYLAALQVFSLFGARYMSMSVDQPELGLTGSNPSMLYTVPTFRNPDTICYDDEQRARIAATCDARDIILFEDDPYRDLAYEPCERTPICSLLKRTNWIYQGTLSKTLAPGLRLGFLVCSEPLYPYLLRLKQAADLHSSRVSQHYAIALLQADEDGTRIQTLCDSYRDRRDQFDAHLQTYFGSLATWGIPKGGLFFWLRLKSEQAIDTRVVLPDALRAGVVFMPGEPFHPDGRTASGTFRLNFSHASPSEVPRGLSTLAALFADVSAWDCVSL